MYHYDGAFLHGIGVEICWRLSCTRRSRMQITTVDWKRMKVRTDLTKYSISAIFKRIKSVPPALTLVDQSSSPFKDNCKTRI
jgi:hypothetical protein